jgi:hypothetical protein
MSEDHGSLVCTVREQVRTHNRVKQLAVLTLKHVTAFFSLADRIDTVFSAGAFGLGYGSRDVCWLARAVTVCGGVG